MPRIIVYGTRLSPFVEKVVRALELKKLSYEIVKPRSPGDLRRWNPQTAKMPVVEIDGDRVYDSTFILRRLDQLAPAPPLFADEPAMAAGQRLLEDWADESLYWYGMALRWCEPNAAASADQIVSTLPIPTLLAPVVRRVIRRQVGGLARAQGLGRLPHEELVRELARRLDDLLGLLGERPFFFAERVSAADLALFGMLTMLASGPTPEAAKLIAERPRLRDWRKRVEQATGG